jgi:hypothetical protein
MTNKTLNISEDTLSSWAKGPGQTESDKCDNAVRAIRKAIDASTELAKLDITVFPQGSYRARTNVRQNSDVDVCVRCNSTIFPQYPTGTNQATFGLGDSALTFVQYKNLVYTALVSYFGRDGVTWGNKAFDIHQNTYRIDADVVPTFVHRRYIALGNGQYTYYSGVEFAPDSGPRIINWPDQTYENGVKRNNETSRRYKRLIRVMKRLRDQMKEKGVQSAQAFPSFLVECLVWNASVSVFDHVLYTDMLRAVIVDLWSRTDTDSNCATWVEVNELKYLFRASQPWTREQARQFLGDAWNFVGY